MLKWNDILKFAQQANPTPDKTVEKTEKEWRKQLTLEQYEVTRLHGTEQAFSSEMCQLFEAGRYACVCCESLLFDSSEKFNSGTGWPSFTQPAKDNAISYHLDNTHFMERVEVRCNCCEAHLGHVFPDGPAPSSLRYCINALALNKISAVADSNSNATTMELATFGGGCFWCTEALFQRLKGVATVVSGYSGGETKNPNYRQICTGKTGHAEVIQISFDPKQIAYAELVEIHFKTHDPTTLNQQGADKGTQYRSAIFTHNAKQQQIAQQILDKLQAEFEQRIVTEIKALDSFYPAEDYHQNYFNTHKNQPYCAFNIAPKVDKLQRKFAEKLKI